MGHSFYVDSHQIKNCSWTEILYHNKLIMDYMKNYELIQSIRIRGLKGPTEMRRSHEYVPRTDVEKNTQLDGEEYVQKADNRGTK